MTTENSMLITQAIVALVNAVAAEGTYIGSVPLIETIVRERAEQDLDDALERFVDQRIADKTGAF